MIIVQLKGGLGNQLFQYAAARRLAGKHNTELKLDLTRYSLGEQRPHAFFSLDRFDIRAKIAEKAEVLFFHDNTLLGRAVRKIRTITRTGKIKRICERKHFAFDPAILKLPNNIYLSGYWQSEKYFKEIEDIVREEITLKDAVTSQSIAVEQEIKSLKNTVSLHIRRGDYVSDIKANNYLGLCPLDYYNKCISVLGNELGELNLFIFSDDLDWVKKNLNTDHQKYFVEHNKTENAHEDIYLMSICEHNIIANSSFSWWGAWLNKNKKKKVFAPNQWTAKENCNKLDIVPEEWNRI